jgi:prolyl-tRNA editing enzyme YbaK/EbsC (Cys-tRNA(Pro) deacylase)
MSIESVRAFLAQHAPDIAVIETDEPTGTVELAANVHGVAPAQIAKTLSLRADDRVMLVVMAGDARLNNRKFKQQFGAKARMLGPDDVLAATSHPVGGVCPFGLPTALPVYADRSLMRFDVVVPAAGSINSAVRITPARLVALTNAQWVDLAALLPAQSAESASSTASITTPATAPAPPESAT